MMAQRKETMPAYTREGKKKGLRKERLVWT
jgi:hypothetical protein